MAAAHFLFFYILHLPILFPAAEGKLSTEPNLSAGKKRAKEDGKKENQIYRTKSLSNQIASLNNGGYQTLINRPIKRKTRELFKVLCYTKMQTKEVARAPTGRDSAQGSTSKCAPDQPPSSTPIQPAATSIAAPLDASPFAHGRGRSYPG